MKGLLKKEWKYIIISPIGAAFSISFLLLCGLLLWLFKGSYNILDNAYSSMDSFFKIAPLLLIILIPALTMRSFSEEKKNKTMELIYSQPLTPSKVLFSKIIATWFLITITISTTLIYIISINQLSIDNNNIEIYQTIICYIFTFFLSLIFVIIGIFASALTSNQILALIIGIITNLFVFYGFDLFSVLTTSGQTQLFISSLGLNSHYQQMQNGVLELSSIILYSSYIIFFCGLALFFITRNKKLSSKRKYIFTSIITCLILNIAAYFVPSYRIDFTDDKRYTLSEYSKDIIKEIADNNKKIEINLYLNGELNASFTRLENSTNNLLSDLHRLSKGKLQIKNINPYSLAQTPKDIYEKMTNMGMNGIVLNETDRQGKVSKQIIYPYAQIINESDTLTINLLKRVAGYSAEENINASIENLEFEFMDMIRLITDKKAKSVAFIEGHGEISELYTESITDALSKYFSVNRGQIPPEVGALDDFNIIIIAGPTEKYSEQEKYVIDQYIMKGGKILWLIDGVYLSKEALQITGKSASMKNETNLDDLLFTYGIRINPVLIQDQQSTSILLSSDNKDIQPTIYPFYYSPLLITSPNHPITKDVSFVKSPFASSIDIVNKSKEVKASILLTTSAKSHIVKVPETIQFEVEDIQQEKDYFSDQFLPVAVSLIGTFQSAYNNRVIPDSIYSKNTPKLNRSEIQSKMVVVACSDIIKNEIIGQGETTQALPIGFDRITNQQFGNNDFILNTVNWLANDENWMILKNKHQKLRLLDKQKIYDNRTFYTILNIGLPILLISLIILILNYSRIQRYRHK